MTTLGTKRNRAEQELDLQTDRLHANDQSEREASSQVGKSKVATFVKNYQGAIIILLLLCIIVNGVFTTVVFLGLKREIKSVNGTVNVNTRLLNSEGKDKEQVREDIRRLSTMLDVMENAYKNFNRTAQALSKQVASVRSTLQSIKVGDEQLGKELLAQASTDIEVKDMKQKLDHTTMLVDFVHVWAKQEFYRQKMALFDELMPSQFFRWHPRAKQALLQASLNYNSYYSNVHHETRAKATANREYERLSQKFHFQKDENSFCFLVSTRNNVKDFKYEYNLKSIYNLDYDAKKIRVIITDDASTDGTADFIQQYLDEHPTAINFTLIRNEKRLTPLPNHHRAITEYCSKDDIIVFLDGDDELLSPYSLKVFNSVYQTKGVDVVYSDNVEVVWHEKKVTRGWSNEYPEQVRKANEYREYGQSISHLRSFKAKLYYYIKLQDLKDWNGNWFTTNCDDAILNPILELSCGRIEYLKEEYFYLYNFGTGGNDWETQEVLMNKVIDYIRFKKQKYQCVEKYDKPQQIRQ